MDHIVHSNYGNDILEFTQHHAFYLPQTVIIALRTVLILRDAAGNMTTINRSTETAASWQQEIIQRLHQKIKLDYSDRMSNWTGAVYILVHSSHCYHHYHSFTTTITIVIYHYFHHQLYIINE